MSYILPNQVQLENVNKFKNVMTDTKIHFAYFKHAVQNTKYFKDMCKKANLNPSDENSKIGWYHLYLRYRRGL